MTTRVPYSMTNAPVNVRAFGAKGDGVTDDRAAIQAAIAAADANVDTVTGNVIYFPRGRYMVSAPIVLDTAHVDNLSSLTLVGEGLHNTVIEARTGFSGAAIVTATNQTYCGLKDLHLLGSGRVAAGVAFTNGSHHTFERVFVQSCTGEGFSFADNFMLTLKGCRAKSNQTGFAFNGFHTSTYVENCYALNNTSSGFGLRDMVYSAFVACASDTNLYGYFMSNLAGVTFTACGAEDCGRSAFYVFASAARDAADTIDGCRATLTRCFATNCDTAGLGYGSIYSEQVDTSTIDVTVEDFYEYAVTGSVSVATNAVATNHALRLEGGRFINKQISAGLIGRPVASLRVDALSVTGTNTVLLNLTSLFRGTAQYSGLLHIVAGNDRYSADSATNVAAYLVMVTKSTGGSAATVVSSNGLTAGGSASHPSFTFTLDTTNNELEVSPVASTSGTFYFYITNLGGL